MIVVSAQPLPRSLQELLLLLHSSLSDSSLRFLTSPACFRQASLAALPPSPSSAVARALQSLLFHTFSLPPCLPTNATRVLVVADEIDESFLAALRELDVPAENAVYVGDSDVDVLTGHNAGLAVCGAEWGFRGREELTRAGADLLAGSMTELAALLLDGTAG